MGSKLNISPPIINLGILHELFAHVALDSDASSALASAGIAFHPMFCHFYLLVFILTLGSLQTASLPTLLCLRPF